MHNNWDRALCVAIFNRALLDVSGGNYIPPETQLDAKEFLREGNENQFYQLYDSVLDLPDCCQGNRLAGVIKSLS